MDTYSWLREFADSWWLIAMTAFFLGVSGWALRPWARERHAEIASIPLRNDTMPPPASDGADTTDPAAAGRDRLTDAQGDGQ